MLTGMPSAASALVAARPGASRTAPSRRRARAACAARGPRRPSRPASSETTSADTGPPTSSQMRRMMSPGSPSSLASSDGFVVAPERTPQAAISSTSATDPVSMKSLMCPRTLPGGRGSTSAPRRRAIEAAAAPSSPSQDAPHAQEVGRLGDVVDAQDRRAGVGGPRRRRRASPASRSRGRAAGDRAEEVLARDGEQQREAERVQARRARAAPRPSRPASCAKSGPGSSTSRSAATPAARAASSMRSRRKATTSPTTSSSVVGEPLLLGRRARVHDDERGAGRAHTARPAPGRAAR